MDSPQSAMKSVSQTSPTADQTPPAANSTPIQSTYPTAKEILRRVASDMQQKTPASNISQKTPVANTRVQSTPTKSSSQFTNSPGVNRSTPSSSQRQPNHTTNRYHLAICSAIRPAQRHLRLVKSTKGRLRCSTGTDLGY